MSTLIATLGSEPQVETTTLDLLQQKVEKITCVDVIHTVDHGTPIAAAVATIAVFGITWIQLVSLQIWRIYE